MTIVRAEPDAVVPVHVMGDDELGVVAALHLLDLLPALDGGVRASEQAGQAAGLHLLPVIHGVTGEDVRLVVEADQHGLMPWGVAGGREDDQPPVVEDVVLAVQLLPFAHGVDCKLSNSGFSSGPGFRPARSKLSGRRDRCEPGQAYQIQPARERGAAGPARQGP